MCDFLLSIYTNPKKKQGVKNVYYDSKSLKIMFHVQ